MTTMRLSLLALGFVLGACGGESGERVLSDPREPALPPPIYTPDELAPSTDVGTGEEGALDCAAAERPDLEFVVLEDYEFGAAAGFYPSADICAPCQDIVNARDAFTAGSAEFDALTEQLASCTPACVATQRSPAPGYIENPPRASLLNRPRCGSRYAMYVDSGPLLDWGGNMGIQFNPPRNVIEDGFDGISFWARRSASSRSNLRIEVGEPHTDQNYTGGPGGGPICNPNTTEDNSEEGCDHFGAFVVLREEWQQFFVPFAEMRQAGWGRRAEEFDLRNVMALTISYAQGDWQFWIDDLAFYRQAR
jgi:hypothetical protein